MESYISTLKSICNDAASTLKSITENDLIKYRSYKIDCSNLHIKYLTEDIRDAEWFSEIRKSNAGPTLYLIEKLEGPANEELAALFNLYKARDKNSLRATSAIKKNPDYSTNYLYVGKVKQFFRGRVIQHLGFHSSDQTAGLQLFHWLQDKPMVIQFHAYSFPEEMSDYMAVLEYEFARKLKPLIGKHR